MFENIIISVGLVSLAVIFVAILCAIIWFVIESENVFLHVIGAIFLFVILVIYTYFMGTN